MLKRKLNQEENSNDSNQQNLNLLKETSSQVESKIRQIIETNFDEEINYKKYELDKINERIFEAQNMLDKLRVCIICNYYSLNGRLSLNEYMNHPAVASLKCEHLESTIVHCKQLISQANGANLANSEEMIVANSENQTDSINRQFLNLNQQFDVKIFVGNVSKYLNNNTGQTGLSKGKVGVGQDMESLESSQYNQDLITHKWMVYIRSPNCSKLENYIKKVIFYLHSSYKPYDMVEVKTAPFQLVRRGWGEFPIHAQIHFKDARNKRVDINHNLKLDWTQTGLQTFGGETSLTTKLVLKPNDFINDNNPTNKPKTNSISPIPTPIPPEEAIPTTPIQQINPQPDQENSLSNLPNEINSNYSLDSAQTDLKRNFSFSSLSSSSNSMTFPPVKEKQVDLSPPNFISTELDSFPLNTTNSHTNSNLDELIISFCTTNKPEEKIEKPKAASAPSVDELLNLRPKSIQLPIKPVGNPIKQVNTTTLLLPNKIPNLSANLASQIKQVVPSLLPIKPSTSSNSFLNSLSKKMVIYKVGSNDVRKDVSEEKTNLNNTNKQIGLQLNSSQTSLSLGKKVKLTTDQLTKIKNNSLRIAPPAQSLETINKSEPIDEQKSKTNEIESIKEEPINIDNLCSEQSLIESTQSKKSILKFEHLIQKALKHYPIINHPSFHLKADRTRKRKKLCFSAQSIHEYYSWPYAKRKANEWIRALHIKRKCFQLLENSDEKINYDMWSTKTIVLWLRSHGYTPLEYEHMQVVEFNEKFLNIQETPNEFQSHLNYVDSLTSLNRLFNSKRLKEKFCQSEKADDGDCDENILIDVVNIEPKEKKKIENTEYKKNSIDTLRNNFGYNRIEMCHGSKYAREQIDMLNLKTSPVNIVPSGEKPTQTNIYTCNLVEKFLFTLGKRFAEDLIRQTCSDIYFDSSIKNVQTEYVNNKKNPHPHQQQQQQQQIQSEKSLLYQKFPQSLGVQDVFNTIKKHEKYDFLTNKYMAAWSSTDQSTNNDLNENTDLKSSTNLNKSILRKNFSESQLNK